MKKLVALLSLITFISCGDKKEDSGKKEDKENMETTDENTTVETDNSSNDGFKKYDIKSGIITLETSMEVSGMNMKKKSILYFDDYGIKESQEDFNIDPSGKEVFATRDFVKDGYRYTCSVEYGSGAKTKAMGYGTAARFNMDEASTMKDNKFKKLANTTVAGKDCEGFSMETPSGLIEMYGWSGITLKSVLTGGSIKSTTIAVKVEENVEIPADKFEVPAGVKMTDM